MKKLLYMILVAALAISLVVIGCAPGQQEEEEERTVIELDFATFWPAGDFQVTLGHHKWAEIIRERVLAETTNYSVRFYWYYSVPPGTLRTGVKNGTYHIVTSGPGYHAGVYPYWDIAETAADTALVPRKNAYTMSMAVQAFWNNCTDLRANVTATDPTVQLMHYWSTGPGWFLMICNNNVTKLEDFTEPSVKTIRTANRASNMTVTRLGATGRQVPMSAALGEFQAGTIHGILCPTDTPKGFGLHAFVRSATFAPFSYQFVFWKLMYKPTYDGLPPEVRTIIDQVNAKYCEYYGRLRTWGEELEGIAFCRSSLGWNYTPPDGCARAGWFEYRLPTVNATEYQRWVDRCYPFLKDAWVAENPTKRGPIWDMWRAAATWADTTYGYWSPGTIGPPPGYVISPPPTPPMFP